MLTLAAPQISEQVCRLLGCSALGDLVEEVLSPSHSLQSVPEIQGMTIAEVSAASMALTSLVVCLKRPVHTLHLEHESITATAQISGLPCVRNDMQPNCPVMLTKVKRISLDSILQLN